MRGLLGRSADAGDSFLVETTAERVFGAFRRDCADFAGRDFLPAGSVGRC